MKIVFAHDHVFSIYNNIVYSTGGLSREILERYTSVFEEVQVVSRQEKIENFNHHLSIAQTDNVSFTHVPNFHSLNNFHKKSKAKRIVEREIEKTDAVIARLPSSIGNMAIELAKKHNKPYLIEVVGCSWDAYKNHGRTIGKIIAPFAFLKQRKNISGSPYTIYITKEFLQNRYPTQGKEAIISDVMINRVDDSILNKRIRKIKEKDRPIKFGLVGSLNVDYKGHKTLLEALNIIKDEIPDFKIEFLGGGNSERWTDLVEKLGLCKHVNFLGRLESGNTVLNWMDTVDIAVQPSLAEGQGRSIIEFMSRGCPVIATNVGGITELIAPDFLVKPNDSLALSKKILEMLDKESMLEQSKINFEESKKYSSSILDKKREDILRTFKVEVSQ